MLIRPGTRTVAMIAGTVFAAAGLNLGVLALRDPTPSVDVAGVSPEADASTKTGGATTGPTDAIDGVAFAEIHGAPAPEALSAPSIPAPAPAESPPTSAPNVSLSTLSSPTTVVRTPLAVEPSAIDTEYLTYDFTGIAEIVIALHDGRRLEFWSVATAPGWVSRVDDDEPDKVKIKFQRLSDGEEAEFEVRFEDGELDVRQEA